MEFTNSGKKLTADAINELEAKYGIKFTKLFAKFLLDNNGGRPEKSTFRISNSQGNSIISRFYSIGDTKNSLSKYIDILEGRIPSNFIPIANDPSGNIICLGIQNEYYENIFFWDHEQENDDADMSNMYFLAKNIYDFVESLHD
jgi:hypothetical protein